MSNICKNAAMMCRNLALGFCLSLGLSGAALADAAVSGSDETMLQCCWDTSTDAGDDAVKTPGHSLLRQLKRLKSAAKALRE